jgi:hypothetical protein
VAGGVDFDDIEGSAAVARKFNTAGANAAGSVGRTFSTVKAACQDAGRGCLATTTWTTEEISVVHTVSAQCRHQGIGDMGLPNNVSEGFRPVTAIQCGSHSSIVRARTDNETRLKVFRHML